jgi:hypothetical protein
MVAMVAVVAMEEEEEEEEEVVASLLLVVTVALAAPLPPWANELKKVSNGLSHNYKTWQLPYNTNGKLPNDVMKWTNKQP